jgi:hypothetical protein
MADAVVSTITFESKSELEYVFTNISDGTGEAAVLKVDVSALTPACDEVSLVDLEYATDGMAVRLLWDADTDTVAFLIPANQHGRVDFTKSARGVLRNDSSTGKTGDVKLTTVGHTSGDSYWIRARFRKMATAEL